jgi:hypothetical protein
MFLDEKRMLAISEMAERFAKIEGRPVWLVPNKEELRQQSKEICRECGEFTSFELAYFCQQAVSFCPDVTKASQVLNVLAHRMNPENQP